MTSINRSQVLFVLPPQYARPAVCVQAIVAILMFPLIVILPLILGLGEGMSRANDVYVRLTLPHCQQGDRHFAKVMVERIDGRLIGTSITETGGVCDAITIRNAFPIDTVLDEYGRPVSGSFTRDLADFRDGDKAFRFAAGTIEVEPLLTGWYARIMRTMYSLLFVPLGFVLFGLLYARILLWAYYDLGTTKAYWPTLYTATVRLIFPLGLAFALVLSGLQSLDNPESDLASALVILTAAPLVGVFLCVLESKWLIGYWRSKRAELASAEPALEA